MCTRAYVHEHTKHESCWYSYIHINRVDILCVDGVTNSTNKLVHSHISTFYTYASRHGDVLTSMLIVPVSINSILVCGQITVKNWVYVYGSYFRDNKR